MERRKNRLSDPSLVIVAEVAWYLEEAIFLVSEDEAGVQGFVCANPQRATCGLCSSSTAPRGAVMEPRFSMRRSRGSGEPGIAKPF